MDDSLPFGIEAATGKLLSQAVPLAALNSIDEDPVAVHNRNDLHLGAAILDPNNLQKAGWGVVFPGNKDCTPLKAALKDLLDLRQTQTGALFKIFEGAEGYQPGDTAEKWLRRAPRRLELKTVDPTKGVPYYILIVGTPDEIPFDFQFKLDSYFAVGRLQFATLDEYTAYAQKVKAAETLKSGKTVGIVATRHAADGATQSLHDFVALPLSKSAAEQGFNVLPLLNGQATKTNILELLSGQRGGQPALLFTGSHGVRFDMTDLEQTLKQGALLCDNFPNIGTPALPEHFIAEKDLGSLTFAPMIHFFFACYSAGCPMNDTYDHLPGGSERQLMAAATVAKLPQGMLSRGALAVIGHVDRAWTSSFMGAGQPQIQDFQFVVEQLLAGFRIGQAMDAFNQRWAVLSINLSDVIKNRQVPDQVSDDELIAAWKARNDARNYVVLGDPAVRLNF